MACDLKNTNDLLIAIWPEHFREAHFPTWSHMRHWAHKRCSPSPKALAVLGQDTGSWIVATDGQMEENILQGSKTFLIDASGGIKSWVEAWYSLFHS